jgi:signal transduction histidine kinase
MRQRLASVAGTLTVESEPQAGTSISAIVPAVAAGSPPEDVGGRQ